LCPQKQKARKTKSSPGSCVRGAWATDLELKQYTEGVIETQVKIRKVYYCDFCKKHSLSPPSLAKHEKHCTMNPDRECRLCERGRIRDLVEKYKDRYEIITEKDKFGAKTIKVNWKNGEVKLQNIIADCEGCPNCVLTVIRINGFNIGPVNLGFHYREALDKWWAEVNAEERRKDEWL